MKKSIENIIGKMDIFVGGTQVFKFGFGGTHL